MKCIKCGAELKEGCIYCSVCGREAQMVPDYSVLEDDYLRSILKEENEGKQSNSADSEPSQKKNAASGKKKKAKKNAAKKNETQKNAKQKHNKTPIIVVCIVLVVLILSGVSAKLYIDYKNANSYDYQVGMAENELIDKNYESALNYYSTALTLEPNDIPVRLAMADLYMTRKEYDYARILFQEVIGLDASNQTAYKNLIAIYEKEEDYDSIIELAAGITDSNILELFAGYIVATPDITPEAGTHYEYITVTLFSVEDYDIYYTLDGSEPDTENGILYDAKKKIELEKGGRFEVKAVCCNEKGILSPVASATYVIREVPPEYAAVSPDGGRITETTTVTITAEEGCSIYYTWDGTDPTDVSAKYEAPLEIPEGNNILSVLVINDKSGLDSGVYRTNFIYYPQE
ncbi:MAG: chitobiase/beta-hexosaminidase C-terminal domain-containing protein [Roseburia sp.]|nr:chitobiase/beta-hexosaminidase C-terminal domain-containing protein [Roseburia sp.]